MSATAQEMTAPQAERLARARAVLGTAEQRAARWGGRIDRTALRAVPCSAPESGAEIESGPEVLGARLPVPAPLRPLFPAIGLRAGSALAVTGTGTTSLLLSLAVAAVGEDSWCAIAGMPDLGLRSALDAGMDPCRLALAPGPDLSPQALSALVDGVGVLVLGPDLQLAPALWRSLLDRARTADTLVLAAAPPGRADIQLESRTRTWSGLGAGSGRLRRRLLQVTSQGRGIAGQRSVEVLLPEVRGTIAATATATAVPASAPAAPSRPVLHAVRRAG